MNLREYLCNAAAYAPDDIYPCFRAMIRAIPFDRKATEAHQMSYWFDRKPLTWRRRLRNAVDAIIRQPFGVFLA